MSYGVIRELEKIMRNFLWKGADGDGGITWFRGRKYLELNVRVVEGKE